MYMHVHTQIHTHTYYYHTATVLLACNDLRYNSMIFFVPAGSSILSIEYCLLAFDILYCRSGTGWYIWYCTSRYCIGIDTKCEHKHVTTH